MKAVSNRRDSFKIKVLLHIGFICVFTAFITAAQSAEAGLPRLPVSLAHVTQALLNAKVSVATAAAAQAGYFPFP